MLVIGPAAGFLCIKTVQKVMADHNLLERRISKLICVPMTGNIVSQLPGWMQVIPCLGAPRLSEEAGKCAKESGVNRSIIRLFFGIS